VIRDDPEQLAKDLANLSAMSAPSTALRAG
jgi:hypothetical protein